MWKTKKFKTNAEKEAWIEKNKDKIQYTEIFINNGYAVEYKPLRQINVG